MHEMISYSDREDILRLAMEFLKHSQIEGDYLEFGVFQGQLFSTAYHIAQSEGLSSMRFHAFDSFEGLPEVKGIDTQGFQHFETGEFSSSEQVFLKTLKTNNIDLAKTTVSKGFFSDTLSHNLQKELQLHKAAIVYVDCDLYESTVPVLDFVRPLIGTGTIIMFDDWYCFRADPNLGEQRAFTEWLECNPALSSQEYRKYGWHGNSFVLSLKTQS